MISLIVQVLPCHDHESHRCFSALSSRICLGVSGFSSNFPFSEYFVEWGCGRTGRGWIGEGCKSPHSAFDFLRLGPTKEWEWNLEALLLCYILSSSTGSPYSACFPGVIFGRQRCVHLLFALGYESTPTISDIMFLCL